MLLGSAGLLLLLVSGLQAGAAEQEVRAMVGSDVRLGCVHPRGGSFDLSDLMVYWQVGGSQTVVAYYFPENSSASHQDGQYRNRASLSPAAMRRGDFSLHLRNITPHDGQTFDCLVFRKSVLEKMLEAVVTLHVAANYSLPVVSTASGASPDGALTFTCTSSDGYPRPNVYWINRTDNSLLDEALHNSTVSRNARGLYDVLSVLRVLRPPAVDVGCWIENVVLQQNLTGAAAWAQQLRASGRVFQGAAGPSRSSFPVCLPPPGLPRLICP
ncbi:LOW QUALITY PROTEIN: ICOS ligand [Lepus europaeus]|uniref:LOW QUALITY PROTEIN: ICOS ligand n=1 Tax=Lepus europaeus TaxID=9983 RepID=UPI002B4A83B7|nr:LOW QUALITY PROTEIN: ICOS ligand [Lepus europaeus]